MRFVDLVTELSCCCLILMNFVFPWFVMDLFSVSRLGRNLLEGFLMPSLGGFTARTFLELRSRGRILGMCTFRWRTLMLRDSVEMNSVPPQISAVPTDFWVQVGQL